MATVQYTVLCHACLQYCTVSCTSTIQYCNVPSMFKVPYCALHVYSAVQCHICLLYLTCVPGVSAVSACAGVEAPPGGGVGGLVVAQVPLTHVVGQVTQILIINSSSYFNRPELGQIYLRAEKIWTKRQMLSLLATSPRSGSGNQEILIINSLSYWSHF